MKGYFNRALALALAAVMFFSLGTSAALAADSCSHNYESTQVSATCSQGAYMKYTCKECGDIQTFIQSDPLGHDWGEWIVEKASSCLEDGKKYRICGRCEFKEEEVLPKSGHTSDGTETVKEATCTEPGLQKFTCVDCKEDVEKAIEAPGHKTVVYPAVEATCTADGKTEGKYCSRCKTMFETQEIIPAKGHDEEITAEIPATCTENGMTEGRICKTCGEVTKERTEIKAFGHTPVTSPAVAPTCLAAGLTEGVKCADCNLVFTEQTIVPTTGHTAETIPALPATCTKTGLTEGISCSVCKTVIKAQELLPATGHNEVHYSEIAPTCDEIGRKAGIQCSVCLETISGLEAIPPLGHTEEIYAAVEATCTEAGKSEGRKCMVCGMVTKEQTIVPAKGHTEVVDYAVAATCQRTGLTEGRHCIVCNAVVVEQKEVPKGEHYIVSTSAVAATCTTGGKSSGKSCAVCSLVIEVPSATPALGHTLKDELVKATTSKDGEAKTYCTRCNRTISSTPIKRIKSIKLSAVKYIYDGKSKAPSVTVTDSAGKKLVKNTDYAVKYSSGRTNPGKYSVKITFKGNYSGSKTLSYTIAPPKTTVTAKQSTNAIKLTWTAVKGAYGYRVYQYNTKTGKWTTLIKATKATQYTFKSLDAGTAYTYAVKPYARDGGVIWGNYTQISAVTKPLAPTISSAESNANGSATIKWSKVTGATGYVVYYATSKNGSYKRLGVTSNTNLTKTKLSRGRTYYIKVKAYTKSAQGNIYSSASNARTVYVK